MKHGGLESFFEPINMALGLANESRFTQESNTSVRVKLNLRPGALRFFIIVGDEDDDSPYYDVNKWPGMVRSLGRSTARSWRCILRLPLIAVLFCVAL